MKFEHTRTMNWEGALRGMRNPLNSWHKSDSLFGICNLAELSQLEQDTENKSKCYLTKYSNRPSYITYLSYPYAEYVSIGNEDMKLAQKLIRAGSEHRKFMRQIFVCVDITAPLYWWKEFDTYKVATVRNSCSTMHKIHSKPFDKNDFAYDAVNDVEIIVSKQFENTLTTLEYLRIKFNETQNKKYWKALIQMLPDSYEMKATLTFTYENLLGMCSKGQRRNHKLNEWSGKDNPNVPYFIGWARTLPYAPEFLFFDETEDKNVTT